MTSQSLLDANIHALREGAELLEMLNCEQFSSGFKPAVQATIGAHYRHILEHYRCLLIQVPQGVFCYDKRERDEKLESDRDYALQSIAIVIAQLELIDLKLFNQSYRIVDHQLDGPLTTTLARELLFLQSHTVHHYSMIAAIARGLGKQLMDDFGVAIATIKHRDEKNKDEKNRQVVVEASPESEAMSVNKLTSTESKPCAQ